MIAICALAWNAADHTERWLRSVRATQGAHEVNLYLLDNGSRDPAQMARIFRSASPKLALRNEDNRSIYAGWNRLATAALADAPEVLILSNNDLVCAPGWLDAIVREVRAGGDRYFLPNGDVPSDPARLAERAKSLRQADGPKTEAPARAGWCMIFPPRALPLFLPIPECLELWYGDDYIHDTLALLGWSCETILDCAVFHATSVSMMQRPGYVEIVARDRAQYAQIQAAKQGRQ